MSYHPPSPEQVRKLRDIIASSVVKPERTFICDSVYTTTWPALGLPLKIGRAHLPGTGISAAINFSGDHLVSVANDKMLKIWSTATGELIKEINIGDSAIFCAIRPDDNEIAICTESGLLKLYDFECQSRATLRSGDTGLIKRCAYSPDGKWLALGGYNSTHNVAIWSCGDYGQLPSKLDIESHVYYLTYHPTDNLLLFTSAGNSLQLWDITTKKCIREFHSSPKDMGCCAFNPKNHDEILSAGDDGLLRIWNWRTGECKTTFMDVTVQPLRSCTYNADATLIVSTSGTRISIWDPTSLTHNLPTMILKDYFGSPLSFSFNKDGSKAISVNSDAFIYSWDFSEFNRRASEIQSPRQSPTPRTPPTLRPSSPSPATAAAAAVAIPREIKHRELTYSDPKIKLGEGGFGVVYRGKWEETPVAIKELKLRGMSTDTQAEFDREVQMHSQLHHKHIVVLYGAVHETPQCLVLELMQGGSLRDWIKNKTRALPELGQTRLAHEIAQGLEFLHSRGIIHRDLKSANVLLDGGNTAKLSDFGLAKLKGETITQGYLGHTQGTVPWIAPELFIRRAKYSVPSDIYAYGMTLWEMCARQLPFVDAPSQQLIITWVGQGTREDIPADAPDVLRQIIGTSTTGCWAAEPANRHTLSHILQLLRDYRAAQGKPLGVADALVGAMAAAAVADDALDSMPVPDGGHTRT